MVTTAVTALVAAGPVLAKGVVVQVVPVQGSDETDVFGINDSNAITGSWYDPSGAEHGYVGSFTGANYTTFDDSTDPGTEPRGINNAGYVSGFDNSGGSSPSAYIPFERAPSGAISNVAMDGNVLNGLIQGINNKNVFTGGYENSNLQFVGYIGANGKYSKGLNLKGITSTGFAGRGVNDKGDIVGWYYDTNGVQHGLLLPSGKTAVRIDDPDKSAVSTVLEGINNNGEITGQWTDSSSDIHGFVFDSMTKKFTALKINGAVSFVQPWGINSKGDVAVGSDVGYYIWCPSQKVCPVGAPAIKVQHPWRKLLPKFP